MCTSLKTAAATDIIGSLHAEPSKTSQGSSCQSQGWVSAPGQVGKGRILETNSLLATTEAGKQPRFARCQHLCCLAICVSTPKTLDWLCGHAGKTEAFLRGCP